MGSTLDRTFAALSDPTRRAIVERLAAADCLAVSELAAPFDMSLPAVLKHVGVLTEAGLVAREKIGRIVYCRLAAGPMRPAQTWLAQYEPFWRAAEAEPAVAEPVAPAASPEPAPARKPAARRAPARKPAKAARKRAQSRSKATSGRSKPVVAKRKVARKG